MLEKIKQFFANMTSKQKYGVIGGAAAVVVAIVAIIVIALTGGNNEQPSDVTTAGGDEKTTYTIEVKTEGGRVLSDVSVFFYEDSTLAELVTIGETDEEGKLSFTDVTKDTYVAVLRDLPDGYQVEESYALTGEVTEIVISTAVLADTGLDGVTYQVGDVIHDFTVTTPDGTEYKLSDLLKEKKAVVLNFWYTKCDPCKQEFPHLQAAYETYKDKIELLAINPVEADDAAIAAFQTDLGLTFPMAQGDAGWQNAFSLVYPTTVVVDRYGVITLIHKGTVPSTETFENVFETFTAEDYVQTLYGDMTAFAPEESTEDSTEESTEESTEAAGSKANPIELGGVSEFEAEVKSGEQVYYNLYRVNEMIFTLEDKDAYVICGDETYEPVDGVISFILTTEDMNTPASVVIGNSGREDKTFKVTLGLKEGTFNNPYPLEMGELVTDLEAGNEQGVYYLYNATENGIVTIKNISTSDGAVHGYVLYNLTTYAQRTLEESSDGTVSIEVNEGDQLMVTVAVLPNEENEYPAASIISEISFEKSGEATEDPTDEPTTGGDESTQGSTEVAKKTYTVIVKNQSGKALSGVTFTLNGKSYTTDSSGTVSVSLPVDYYVVKITSVPNSYNKPNGTYSLTPSKTTVNITLSTKSSGSTTEAPDEEPTTEQTQGTTQAPTTQAPTTQEPTTQAPTTQEPTTQAPTTQESTEAPTQAPTDYPNNKESLGEGTAVELQIGANQLSLTPGVTNYFVFNVTTAGKYQISVNHSTVKVGYAGSNVWFAYDKIDTSNVVNNVLTSSISQHQIPDGGSTTLIIGLDVPAGVTSCTLTVTRASDADKTIEDVPQSTYFGTTVPTKQTITESGTLAKVDLTSSSTAVLGSDGYYHLNSATGPILYVDLVTKDPISISEIVLNENGRASLKVYYDANGDVIVTENANLVAKIVEYAPWMTQYVNCVDNTYGIYPLNAELMMMIQDIGEFNGWWNSSSKNYQFGDYPGLNPETAWMFVCRYFE